MDITPWTDWFFGCLGRAIKGAQSILGSVLSKAHFWETFGDALLNERQRLVVNRHCVADIAALVERGILVRNPEGGRSTSYSLAKVT